MVKDNKPLRFNTNQFLVVILFIVYPLAAVPFIFSAMLNRKKYGFILYGFFMGLLGMLLPPTGDFYRYTKDFFLIERMDWQQFVIFVSLKLNVLLPYISFIISKFGLNFDFTRFLYDSTSYILLGLLYLKILKSNQNIKKKDWMLLIIFIGFGFVTFLFRFFFAMVLFLYGAYQIIYFNKRSGWIFMILSILSHLTFIIFVFGFVMSRFNLFNLKKQFVLVLCIVSLFIDASAITYLLNFLPIEMVDHYMNYIDGKWAGDFLEDHSLKYRLMLLFGSGIIYCSVVIYYLLYKKFIGKERSLSNYILIMVAISSPFVTINGRFLIVFFYNFKMLFLKYYENNKFFRKCKYILLILVISSIVSDLWSNRRQWNLGDGQMIFYSSCPTILMHSYTERWIDQRVSGDGDFKK